jgi:hypothetical protein
LSFSRVRGSMNGVISLKKLQMYHGTETVSQRSVIIKMLAHHL